MNDIDILIQAIKNNLESPLTYSQYFSLLKIRIAGSIRNYF